MSGHFDDDALKAAYEPVRRASTTTHGPDCPSEGQLLSAVRGAGEEAERLRVLDHALKCPACRRELALLHAVSSAETHAAPRATRDLSWRRWMPAALAASMMLAVGLAGVVRWRTRRAEDITRGGAAAGPVLVAPGKEAAVSAGLTRFVWRTVPGVIQYTLEIDATDGTVLFSSTTRDTTLTATIAPTATGNNRWIVRAKLQDGSEQRSESRVLRVR